MCDAAIAATSTTLVEIKNCMFADWFLALGEDKSANVEEVYDYCPSNMVSLEQL